MAWEYAGQTVRGGTGNIRKKAGFKKGEPSTEGSRLKEAAKRVRAEKMILKDTGLEEASGLKGAEQRKLASLQAAAIKKRPEEMGFLEKITAPGSKIRDALLSMGVPVKNMTAEEKKRFLAQKARVSVERQRQNAEEQARLARIAQVGTGLSDVESYVGGGQFGSFGTGIAPRGM